jgi:HlyD family secretion protein
MLVIVFAVALVGGAGYVGFQSSRAENSIAASQPQTVPVTRGDVQQTVTAPGGLVSTRQVMLSMDVSGRLAEVNVRPGDHVEAGQVLACLEITDLEQAVADAELSLRQAELRLEKLQEPASEADIRRAEHAVSQAADKLKVAQIDLDGALNSVQLNEVLEDAQSAVREAEHRYEVRLRQHEEEGIDYWYVDQAHETYEDARLALARAQYAADQQVEGARSQVNAASQAYQEAQDALQELLDGTAPVDVELARLEVEAARLDLEKAHTDLERAVLVAPFGGIVLDVRANPAEKVSPGADVILLADPASLEAGMEVIEEDLSLVQVGQTAELYFDAVPDAVIRGQVTRIVPLRISDERPLYAVYVALDQVPQVLAAGMTADASFIIDQRTDVLQLPRSLVRARSDGTATLQVWVNGRIEERTVEVGLRGDVYVEILSGVQEGDQVVAE